MKIYNGCKENRNCPDCKEYQVLNGFSTCQHYKCAEVNSSEKNVLKKCEEMVNALDALLKQNERALHDILQKEIDNENISTIEENVGDQSSKYVFTIRPTLRFWITTKTPLPKCGESLYALIGVEEKIRKALGKLNENM